MTLAACDRRLILLLTTLISAACYNPDQLDAGSQTQGCGAEGPVSAESSTGATGEGAEFSTSAGASTGTSTSWGTTGTTGTTGTPSGSSTVTQGGSSSGSGGQSTEESTSAADTTGSTDESSSGSESTTMDASAEGSDEDPMTCGDERIDLGEQCDGINLGTATCASLGFGSGRLLCDAHCEFDTTGCSLCGNDQLDGDELCDGPVFADADDCADVGLGQADEALGCTSDCKLDFSACKGCGDGMIVSPEDCEPAPGDGEDPKLGNMMCSDFGWDGGQLDCQDDCRFDMSGCYRCGDGLVQGAEACDGNDFAGRSCRDFRSPAGPNFERGQLHCTASCAIDTRDCSYCGDGAISGGESCDGDNLANRQCKDLPGFSDGVLACATDCLGFDTSSCTTCGNGEIEAGEDCEGTDLNGQDCISLNFAGGGPLRCASTCTFDTNECWPADECGNGIVRMPEICDCGAQGSKCTVDQLLGKQCADLSVPGKSGKAFTGGNLGCQHEQNQCLAFDVSGCWYCGDGTKNPGEECDDGNDDDLDGCKRDCTPTCSADGDCNDNRSCTTDRCEDSRCVNTEIDMDGDGHSTCNARDCCDSDPDAFPGQPEYFPEANDCGDFDFNCDDDEEPRYAAWTYCAFENNRCGIETNPEAECGQSRPFNVSCEWDFETKRCLGGTNTLRTQSCR